MPEKDMFGNLIGRGETVALKILREMFPTYTFFTQVPVSRLYNIRAPKDYPKPSRINQKRTVDIIAFQTKKRPVDLKKVKAIVFRVQNKENHTGTIAGRNDRVQKEMFEDWDIKVIDLHERESSALFKDRVTWESRSEVGIACKLGGLKP